MSDPFSPQEAPGISLIVLMRIYDATMALLDLASPERAAALHEIHARGGIVGSLPKIEMTNDTDSQD